MTQVLTHELLRSGCKSFTTDEVWKFEDSWHESNSFQFIVRKGGKKGGAQFIGQKCQECQYPFRTNNLISRGKRGVSKYAPVYCQGLLNLSICRMEVARIFLFCSFKLDLLFSTQFSI